MKKPLIYPDLINLINISSSNLITIAKNIWLNVTSKTLVKLIRKEIYVSSLTNKELDLLLYILSEGNAAKSKIDILKSVFGYGDQIPTHTLETHMSRLRKKLEPEVTIANSESGYVINTKETAKK
jgi:DNA-binding response OmpR family regulator